MDKSKDKNDIAFARSFWNHMKKLSYNVKEGDKKVFCQVSGEELTEIGCYIGDDGRSYCGSYDANKSPLKKSETFVNVKYYKPNKVQEAIKEGKLVHFGKLTNKEIVKYNKLERFSSEDIYEKVEELAN